MREGSMKHGKRAPRRREGRPRMTLDEAERQWHGPRRRHIEKNKGAYLRAFMRHVHDLWPSPLRTRTKGYALCSNILAEMQCAYRPPFLTPAIPMPPQRPTREEPGTVPRLQPPADRTVDGHASIDEARAAFGAEWLRDALKDSIVVAVEHGGAVLHFGEHLHYMIATTYSVHTHAWRHHWSSPSYSAC